MKNNISTVLRCCRVITAAVAVTVLLSIDFSGAFATVIKYASMFLLSLYAGYSPARPTIPPKYTAYTVCLTLAFTVFLSYVMPSESQNVQFDVWGTLSVLFLAPIFEEMFFRGALVSFENPMLSCIAASLFFGILHGNGWIQAGLLGFVFSYFYISSRSIAVPVICHFSNNLLAFLCMYRDFRIPVFILSTVIALLIYLRSKKVSYEKKIL